MTNFSKLWCIVTNSDEETYFENVNWLNFILQPIKFAEKRFESVEFVFWVISSSVFSLFLSLRPGDKKVYRHEKRIYFYLKAEGRWRTIGARKHLSGHDERAIRESCDPIYDTATSSSVFSVSPSVSLLRSSRSLSFGLLGLLRWIRSHFSACSCSLYSLRVPVLYSISSHYSTHVIISLSPLDIQFFPLHFIALIFLIFFFLSFFVRLLPCNLSSLLP